MGGTPRTANVEVVASDDGAASSRRSTGAAPAHSLRLEGACEAPGVGLGRGPVNKHTSERRAREIRRQRSLVRVLVSRYQRRTAQHEAIGSLPLYPDEVVPWDAAQMPELDMSGDSCLALPKLNLQFLTFHDYLLRNYQLFSLESTYEIRDDINDVCQRLKPTFNPADGNIKFNGWARMGVVISEFKVTKVKKLKLKMIVQIKRTFSIQASNLDDGQQGFCNLMTLCN